MKRPHITAKTTEKFRALVCYIPESVALNSTDPHFYGHSNFQECRALINALSEYGFSCDIAGWQDDVRDLRGESYDLLIAAHDQLEYARSMIKKNGKVVLYATNSHWMFNNLAEYKRLEELKKRRNISLIPRRQLKPINFENQIDEIWYLGNSFQKKTYSHIDCEEYDLAISTINLGMTPQKKIENSTKKNFLWFGSRGAVHKGLDLLLEIFTENKDLELHVCGLVDKEADFMNFYRNIIENSPNIHYHGWVPLTSGLFQEIISRCAFVIMPTCSEGGGGAILQCMREGLIPIVTKESTVDTENFGILLETATIDSISEKIYEVINKSNNDLNVMSGRSRDYVEKNHKLSNYETALNEIVKNLVNKLS
jgi:glycosyltransferase involved in cell wall biosynthesis